MIFKIGESIVSIIDDEDFDRVSMFVWHYRSDGYMSSDDQIIL